MEGWGPPNAVAPEVSHSQGSQPSVTSSLYHYHKCVPTSL